MCLCNNRRFVLSVSIICLWLQVCIRIGDWNAFYGRLENRDLKIQEKRAQLYGEISTGAILGDREGRSKESQDRRYLF